MNDWDDHDSEAAWSETTAPCPHCGTEIYDDAERCPACENYVSWNEGPLSGRSRRWVLLCKWGVALALLGMLGTTLLPLLLPLLLGE